MNTGHLSKSATALLLVLMVSAASPVNAETVFPDLHVGNSSGTADGDGTIVAEGKFNVSPLLAAYISTAGSRMIWYPRKSAFRTGWAPALYWNDASIGAYSVAMGYGNKAGADFSTAVGRYNTAAGDSSIAAGEYNSTGSTSIAVGYDNHAYGRGAIAAGDSNWTFSESSTAIGGWNNAVGLSSTVIGYNSIASGDFSAAIGNSSQASFRSSFVLGEGLVSGSAYSTVIGFHRVVHNGNTACWVSSDTLFEIGNGHEDLYETINQIDYNGDGTIEANYQDYVPAVNSNALTVYKNGNVDVQGVITCAPGGDIPMFTGN